MSDEREIRLELVKLAVSKNMAGHKHIVDFAQKIEHYVMTGQAERVPVQKPDPVMAEVPELENTVPDDISSPVRRRGRPPKGG